MWSFDESGFSGVHGVRGEKVVAPKHRAGDYPRTAAPDDYREHWTLGACVNARGQHIGPVWIVAAGEEEMTPAARGLLQAGAPKNSLVWNNSNFSSSSHGFLVLFLSSMVG